MFNSHPLLSKTVFAFSSPSRGGGQTSEGLYYTSHTFVFHLKERNRKNIYIYEPKNKNELFASPQNFVTALFISPLKIEFIKNLYLKF